MGRDLDVHRAPAPDEPESSKTVSQPAVGPSAAGILALQRSAGNAAVVRLLAATGPAAPASSGDGVIRRTVDDAVSWASHNRIQLLSSGSSSGAAAATAAAGSAGGSALARDSVLATLAVLKDAPEGEEWKFIGLRQALLKNLSGTEADFLLGRIGRARFEETEEATGGATASESQRRGRDGAGVSHERADTSDDTSEVFDEMDEGAVGDGAGAYDHQAVAAAEAEVRASAEVAVSFLEGAVAAANSDRRMRVWAGPFQRIAAYLAAQIPMIGDGGAITVNLSAEAPDARHYATTSQTNDHITIARPWFGLDSPGRARALIHEAAHAVEKAVDIAYSFDRLLNLLPERMQLRNADSYSETVMQLIGGSGGPVPGPLEMDDAVDAGERASAEMAIACAEHALRRGGELSAEIYEQAKAGWPTPPPTAPSMPFPALTSFAKGLWKCEDGPAFERAKADPRLVVGVANLANLGTRSAAVAKTALNRRTVRVVAVARSFDAASFVDGGTTLNATCVIGSEAVEAMTVAALRDLGGVRLPDLEKLRRLARALIRVSEEVGPR